MDPALAWLLLGLGLIIVELLTGTFYLLILGVAAMIGAIAGYLGAPFDLQVILVAVASFAGVYLVRRRKSRAGPPGGDNQIDAGQTATLESWLNESQKIARVRYRGALWDAEVAGETVAPGSMVYVTTVEGTRLRVTSHRPG